MVPTTWEIDPFCHAFPPYATLVYGFWTDDIALLVEALKTVPGPTMNGLVSDAEGRRFLVESNSGKTLLTNYSPLRGMPLDEIERREYNAFSLSMEIEREQNRRSLLLET